MVYIGKVFFYLLIGALLSQVIDFKLISDDSRLITAMANQGLIAWKLTFNEASFQGVFFFFFVLLLPSIYPQLKID